MLGVKSSSQRIALFVNDHVPAMSDTVENYRLYQVNGKGYKKITGWKIKGDKAAARKAKWKISSDCTVYGYCVVDDSGTLLWSERFYKPMKPENGDTISVKPTLTLH